jgi:hypothetical protein
MKLQLSVSHYLDTSIKEMSKHCSIEKEVDGTTLYSGKFGSARVKKKRVYLFEVPTASDPNNHKAIEVWDRRSHKEAVHNALEWVTTGRI